MTWLGEIGKKYRDSIENLRENIIFCQRGGGPNPCKILASAEKEQNIMIDRKAVQKSRKS